MNNKITIFTTTYNRGYIIENLYHSLLEQTNKNFEWIIVNDGSNDDTDCIVSKWIEDEKLEIKYFKLDTNGGIANAMNIGIEKANGFLFFKVDSDDVLTPDAIEKLFFFESTIPIECKNKYAGVSGYRFFLSGKSVGTEWEYVEDYIDATLFERKRRKLNGDKAEAYYTSVMRKFAPFPYFEGEKYAIEGILWDRIAHAGYKIRWFKYKIYQCEYLTDGETNHYFENCRKNFRAYSYWINQLMGYKEIPFNERFMALSKYYAVRNTIAMNKKTKKQLFMHNEVWMIIAKIYGYIIFIGRVVFKPNKYRKLERISIDI